MKKIHLFTMTFPYGHQETFLENELAIFENLQLDIAIHPLFGTSNKRETSAKVFSPLIKGLSSYIISLLSLTLYKTFFYGIRDLKSKEHFIKLLKQALILPHVRKRIKELGNEGKYYFYWGTNSANVIIFEDIKHVVRFHGYDLYDSDVEGRSPQVLRTKFIKNLQNACFISQHGMDYFLSKYHYSKNAFTSRLGVIDRGLSTYSNSDTLYMLSCSNLLPIKRVHIIVEALRNINLKVNWTHIGSGILFDEIKESSKYLPKNISVNLLGQLSNSDVHNFIQSNEIDLFINVSSSEGLPVSIMEATSYGIPVIATDVGGTSELVSKEFLLSSLCDPGELKDKINWFYSTHFKSSVVRSEFRSSWQNLVDAKKNYKEFANFLENL